MAEVASVLQRKAEWAAKRAETFEAGGLGEAEVARALAPLTAEGWFLLHDRDLPAGGNVDHVAVGPSGVAVVDAKAWSYPVRVSNGRLYTGKFSKTYSSGNTMNMYRKTHHSNSIRKFNVLK